MKLIAAAAIASLALPAFLSACEDGAEEGATTTVPAGTPTATGGAPTPTPETAAPVATPTQALLTYRNNKYGYELSLPEGWRVASLFVERFAEVISDPEREIVAEDYVLLTSLSQEEEEQAVEQASEAMAIGLSPWFGFAAGESVHIFPMEIIYAGVSVESFLMDVDTAGIVRKNSEIREEEIDSGESVTGLTRREVDDNGDFTYDLVIVEGEKPIILRIVKTPDYDRQAFETVFRSFAR
jgi:uncharacterized protein YoaH (UPF0181 family)